jgi:hypothetical protein
VGWLNGWIGGVFVANGEITKTLTDARALIANPENWCQRKYFEIINGKECYCGAGAVYRVLANIRFDDDNPPELFDNLGRMRGDISHANQIIAYLGGIAYNTLPIFGNFSEYNDKHTHSEVLAVFNRAIDKAQKEGI